jgi:bacterioferritin (cytochrome b1)
MAITQRHARYEHLLQRSIEVRLATISRRSLVRTTAIAGGAALAFGGPGLRALAAQTGTPAMREAPFNGPIDVLNYALTLEHLEAAFYRDGLAMIGERGITALGFDAGVFEYLGEIGAHEAAHVTTLTDVITQLGGTPVAEQKYDFGYSDAAGFLQVALALEDTGVAAYQGAAQYLMDNDDLLTAALTIHGVEARHAAYVAILNGQNPYPEAVNPALTPAEVLKIATPFIQM